MKPLRHPSLFVALLLAAALHGAERPAGETPPAIKPSAQIEVPSPEHLELVKGLVVAGTLKQVIGTFSSYGTPSVGNTFELDLSKLPAEKLVFTRIPDDLSSRSGPSYIPFSAPMTIEQVRRGRAVTGPSRTAIQLSARDAHGKFLIQIITEGLEKGSKVRIGFYKEGGFLGSMAEGEGVLK